MAVRNSDGTHTSSCECGETIALGETYTFWFTNSTGTRTLTNNGTILARVAQHDWSKTKAVYKGTGTVKELAEGSFDIQ